MTISLVILSVVLAVATPIAAGLFIQRTNVQNTFTATNNVMLATEELSSYFHDAVATCSIADTAACATTNGELPFTAASNTSATFFANVYNPSFPNEFNPSGPAKMVISTTASTLTLTETLPNANSCPVMSNLSSDTTCTYPATGKTILTVYDLINTTGPQLATNPPLSYVLAPGAAACPVTNPDIPLTTTDIENANAVCIDLLAQVKGGQASGYTSQAYLVAPAGGLAPGPPPCVTTCPITNYNESVG
jgi:hypothetical protein